MPITVKHTYVSAIPDSGDTTVVQPSNWNADHTLVGLGTMAEQNANNVSITGGSISGTTVSGYIPTTQKGVANGVATLDAGGKVPVSELPAAVLGALSYQGTWDASTNTPTLTSSVGTKGYYYVVNVAGSTNLNGITDWVIGDWAVFNGSIWQKVDNTETVTSVNGQTGAVVLTTTNVAEGTNLYYTDARARASVSAGTGISYSNTTGVITNAAPDQIVALTGAGTTVVTGTYPSFTITSTDANVGDVVGPASATDNAVARYDSTTGKLLQNSVVTIGDTGATTGITTLSASTSVTTPIVQASNSGGLSLKNSGGTTQMSVGAGGGDNMSINVSTNLNGANAQIDISPTGTGHVHIKPSGTGGVEIAPTNPGTMNNMVIGGTTPLAITGTTVTATTFVGSGASLTSIPNSALVNSAITINGTSTSLGGSINVGTVTSVTGTAPVVSSGGATPAISMAAANTSTNGYLTSTDWNTFNGKGSGSVTSVAATVPSFLSVTGSPITTSGTLAISLSGTALPVANGGTGLTAVGTAGNILTSDGTVWVSQAPGIAATTYTRTSFTATVGQTTFTATYTAPYIEVYQNGTLLNATDYTATNGTTVVLAIGAATGDIIETIAYNTSAVYVPTVGTITSASTITPVSANAQYNVTALAVTATVAIPSGSPADGQKLMIRIKDNGTAQTLNWTTTSGGYRVIGTTLPTTTVISKVLYIGCIYNTQDTFWDVVATAQQ
jgi:hypothetical protein